MTAAAAAEKRNDGENTQRFNDCAAVFCRWPPTLPPLAVAGRRWPPLAVDDDQRCGVSTALGSEEDGLGGGQAGQRRALDFCRAEGVAGKDQGGSGNRLNR